MWALRSLSVLDSAPKFWAWYGGWYGAITNFFIISFLFSFFQALLFVVEILTCFYQNRYPYTYGGLW